MALCIFKRILTVILSIWRQLLSTGWHHLNYINDASFSCEFLSWTYPAEPIHHWYCPFDHIGSCIVTRISNKYVSLYICSVSVHTSG